jgi:hypothetical protein
MPYTSQKKLTALVHRISHDPRVIRGLIKAAEASLVGIQWSLDYHLAHDKDASIDDKYSRSCLERKTFYDSQLAIHRINLVLATA